MFGKLKEDLKAYSIANKSSAHQLRGWWRHHMFSISQKMQKKLEIICFRKFWCINIITPKSPHALIYKKIFSCKTINTTKDMYFGNIVWWEYKLQIKNIKNMTEITLKMVWWNMHSWSWMTSPVAASRRPNSTHLEAAIMQSTNKQLSWMMLMIMIVMVIVIVLYILPFSGMRFGTNWGTYWETL